VLPAPSPLVQPPDETNSRHIFQTNLRRKAYPQAIRVRIANVGFMGLRLWMVNATSGFR